LKGKDVAKYLHSEGQDEFVAVFALREFDSGSLLVADMLNGSSLPTGVGPLQIISPGETRHSRADQATDVPLHQDHGQIARRRFQLPVMSRIDRAETELFGLNDSTKPSLRSWRWFWE